MGIGLLLLHRRMNISQYYTLLNKSKAAEDTFKVTGL